MVLLSSGEKELRKALERDTTAKGVPGKATTVATPTVVARARIAEVEKAAKDIMMAAARVVKEGSIMDISRWAVVTESRNAGG
mmetsp:Transcript_102310/g.161634  ORF Transcript_102310/g.161634 Transcript_102310/m.161634 type:complete len:83 (-) Transcript_102310:197-445(-)